MMTKRGCFEGKTIGALIVLFLFCGALWGCAAPHEDTGIDWPESPYQNEDFSASGVLMETAYEAYGPDDKVVSYILINTTAIPVVFDDDFSLEYSEDGVWLTAPVISDEGQKGTYTLQGHEMCRINILLSLLDADLPEGQYRIVRKAGGALYKAEFRIADKRSDVREMDFGYEPLSSLPVNYDGIDAQKDGCYTIVEDGVFNRDAVQFFTDRVYLDIPAKLRTVMLTDEGDVLVRDIIFDPDPEEGTGRFLVVFMIPENSNTAQNPGLSLTEHPYDYLSIAVIDDRSKACLSDYVSYADEAPEGAPLELLSPGVPDNIDLIATLELRTEELMYNRR